MVKGLAALSGRHRYSIALNSWTSAKRLLARLMKKQGMAPRRIITDKLSSYGVAKRLLMPRVERRSH